MSKSADLIAENDLPLDPRFSPERVKSDILFLSDDLLQGRDTGSVGHEIAARFIGARFAAYGLKPMGDDGSWYQNITFQKTALADAPAGLEITGANGKNTFIHGKDVIIRASATEPDLNLSADIVFVGYGIDDAQMGLNDYDGLDVKGKIVIALSGFPIGLPSEAGAHLSSNKSEAAHARGAIGMITIATTASQQRRPWSAYLQYADTPRYSWLDKDGTAHSDTPGFRAGAVVDDEAALALFAGAPKSLAQLRKEANRKGGRPTGFALNASVRFFAQSTAETVTSPNVVAMLPGSDPELAQEVVILSGHLDHIGVGTALPDDADDVDLIYNGAMDNAAGSATLLEVMRVLATDAVAPRRSVMFLFVTGEEKGLLGAEYFAKNPAVPLESIVGNVNLDMPLLTYPFVDVTAFGAEHSTIGRQVAAAVGPMQLALAPDPSPEENLFVRSDHYMFVRQGIPSVFLVTGRGNGGDPIWNTFLATHYHQPSDDANLPFSWRAGARFAEVNYRITRNMADADLPPRWYAKDFFGDLFAPDRAKAEALPQ